MNPKTSIFLFFSLYIFPLIMAWWVIKSVQGLVFFKIKKYFLYLISISFYIIRAWRIIKFCFKVIGYIFLFYIFFPFMLTCWVMRSTQGLCASGAVRTFVCAFACKRKKPLRLACFVLKIYCIIFLANN